MKKWTQEERYRVLRDAEEIRALHERAAGSAYRFAYHIQPVSGLLNDPNGFFRADDGWHLFYQWCPWGAVHGLKYWYHVFSRDLVSWENRGVCLRPDREYDNKGVYSGSALTVGGRHYLFYTGNHRTPEWKRVPYTCLAELLPDGAARKADAPLFGPEPGYTEHQRDPKIFYNSRKKKFYMLIGAQNGQGQGRALLYESRRPEGGWRFAGELRVPGYEAFGDMWECPSLERVDGHDLLIFCPQHLRLPGRGNAANHNGYLLGKMDFDTLTFVPEGEFRLLDYGFDFYAAACAANTNRSPARVLVGWMGLPDVSYPTDEEEWQGALTLPRRLRVRDGHLVQEPLWPAAPRRQIHAGDELPRAAVLDFDRVEDSADIRLFARADGSGGLALRYDAAARTLTLDRSLLERRFNEGEGEARACPLDGDLRGLRVYVDRSSVEVFVNDGAAALTARVFPSAAERFLGLRGGAAACRVCEVRPTVKDDFVV